ncbi:NAD-dependent succinate-semialdehyde dehydrogenase [Aureimonas fodinaquatilis]|uniref:NAD-dependent succinate-semialdehyde dehydrogenase n=1 Tax=Aureimonas fodinaquatilis TaxID=2565783 RepID=A0A5B0DWH6_9HYPH|nr:NAD-dependent succinate-semialdehyde dehydrogenase [Aureimonas fodinaquatilis]KAA0971177.1 NAD-dependent succinate-semialdehyde dehydrogenase [Aureimonas fodinaquatilis]
MYPNTQMLIAGEWVNATGGATLDVLNPATGEQIGTVAKASIEDLDRALEASMTAFQLWKKTPVVERAALLRKAGELLRERADSIARLLTIEQGKPFAEAQVEVLLSADVLDWSAEEARRIYGRLIPSRADGVVQRVIREPVGPVAAFTPWNFPVSQVVKKVAPALAAGCSIIVKAPEETPASPAELIRALVDAGIPAGVVQLVYGNPAEISEHLVPHPTIRKISFTGSVPVGKHLAALAGKHMKRATMELGGHAPVMIFDDVDVQAVAHTMASSKYRNAGQVCVSPTRFMVQESVYDAFVSSFVETAAALTVGDGLQSGVKMGPLVNERRVQAVDELISAAAKDGARVALGGERIGNKGSFYAPSVLADVNRDMRIMNEEPFGPVALMMPFRDVEEVVAEANRLPFGLASYAFSRSARIVETLANEVEVGMLTVNHLGLALPETPFGGVKDSGYGSEGGAESMESFLSPKFVTHNAFY